MVDDCIQPLPSEDKAPSSVGEPIAQEKPKTTKDEETKALFGFSSQNELLYACDVTNAKHHT